MFRAHTPASACKLLTLGTNGGPAGRDPYGKLTAMMQKCCLAALAATLVSWAGAASGQTFETVGTRAAGMGGAFVAVADDASAAYWNPAGLAAGNFFTMVLDRTAVKVDPGGSSEGAASGSGSLVSLGMPALGLSYYRVRTTTLTPRALTTAANSDGRKGLEAGDVRRDTLITHHSGATLVQSIVPGLAVGATLKLVRGIATSTVVLDGDRGELLDDASELTGKGTSRVDLDLGVMATRGRVKAGLTVRNVMQPAFSTAGESGRLMLRRQARAGVAVVLVSGWVVAGDLDVTRTPAPGGSMRSLAAGTEGRVGRKAFVRGGLRVNTAGSRQPVVAAGGSYAVMGSLLLDAQVTGGSDRAQRGWGLAARFVY